MIILVTILSIALLFFFVFFCIVTYYAYKLAKIIMVFEDDIPELLEYLDNVEHSMQGVTEVSMFYEDDTIKNKVAEVMDFVKIAKYQINYMSKKFTDRSKQKYVNNVPTEEDIEDYLKAQKLRDNDYNEGTIVHVGRPR